MSRVDDLFGGDEKAAIVTDRTGRIRTILAVATPLSIVGPFCFTGVPGALLAVWAWYLADEELARVETGAVPRDREARVRRLRNGAFGLMGFCSLSLLGQGVLLSIGMYEGLFVLLQQLWMGV